MSLMADQTQCLVCGSLVDSQSAPSATYHDQTYRFCSEGCHDQFVADPGSFVADSGS